jgi:hypothetical protein
VRGARAVRPPPLPAATGCSVPCVLCRSRAHGLQRHARHPDPASPCVPTRGARFAPRPVITSEPAVRSRWPAWEPPGVRRSPGGSSRRCRSAPPVCLGWPGPGGSRRSTAGQTARRSGRRNAARLATARTVTPRRLERLQQGAEQRGVEIRQAQDRGGLVPPLLGTLQEETKRVTVARNRVGTRLTLGHQPLGTRRVQEMGQRGLSLPRAPPLGRCRGAGSPRGRVLGSRRETTTWHCQACVPGRQRGWACAAPHPPRCATSPGGSAPRSGGAGHAGGAQSDRARRAGREGGRTGRRSVGRSTRSVACPVPRASTARWAASATAGHGRAPTGAGYPASTGAAASTAFGQPWSDASCGSRGCTPHPYGPEAAPHSAASPARPVRPGAWRRCEGGGRSPRGVGVRLCGVARSPAPSKWRGADADSGTGTTHVAAPRSGGRARGSTGPSRVPSLVVWPNGRAGRPAVGSPSAGRGPR